MLDCKLLASGLSPLLLLLLGGAEAPPPTPVSDLRCEFHHAVVEVNSLDRMPNQIQKTVLKNIGDQMVPRGSFFNNTDVVFQKAPFHRFIRAGHVGAIWFVWFEAGGLAYNRQAAVFEDRGSRPPLLIAHRYYIFEKTKSPCEVTDQILDDAVAGRLNRPNEKDIW